MSYEDQSVLIYRMQVDRLAELSRIRCNEPCDLLWLAGRFLFIKTNDDSHLVIEFEAIDTRLERLGEIIDACRHIKVERLQSMFLMDNGFVQDLIYYSQTD